MLEEYRYPKDKIEQVQHCILTHSSDPKYLPETIEAKCIANADSITHFKNYEDMKYVSKIHAKEELKNVININEAAKQWLIKKYERSYKKLTLPKARELVKENYEKIKSDLNI